MLQMQQMEQQGVEQNRTSRIPQHILTAQIDRGPKQKTIGRGKVSAKRSQFMLTINPNISSTLYDRDIEKRIEISNKLLDLNDVLQTEMARGRFIIPMPKSRVSDAWRPPQLTRYVTELQIGGSMGWLHSHSMIDFGGLCFVNVNEMRDFIRSMPNGFHKFNLRIKFIPDTKALAESYIERDTPKSVGNDQEVAVSHNEKQPQTLSELRHNFPLPAISRTT